MTTIQRIRKRRQQREQGIVTPKEPCHKCGAHAWDKDLDPGTWYCFQCGNLAYFNGTDYNQQYDLVTQCHTTQE